MAESRKIGIVEIIQGAGQAEIDEIDSRIGVLRNELAGLEATRCVIAKRMNGAQARKPRSCSPGEKQDRTDPKESLQLQEAMFETIQVEGPMYAGQLAARLLVKGFNASTQRVGILAGKSKWFSKGADGKWRIAKTGEAR